MTPTTSNRSAQLRRFSAVGAVLSLLLGSLLLVAQPASATATCRAKDTGSGTVKTCVTTKVSSRKFLLVFGSGVKNPKNIASDLHCTSNQSKEMDYSVSSTVSGEAGFIFGKVSASVTGGVSKKTNAGYSVSSDVRVPRGKTLFCDWGIYYYTFSGTITKTYCNTHGCEKTVTPFRGKSPARTIWRLSVGH